MLGFVVSEVAGRVLQPTPSGSSMRLRRSPYLIPDFIDSEISKKLLEVRRCDLDWLAEPTKCSYEKTIGSGELKVSHIARPTTALRVAPNAGPVGHSWPMQQNVGHG
jgi:hypothetical protein